MTPTEKLTKELHKLQRDLNSHRLLDYTPGDESEAEADRQRERASKLTRFNEVLATLNAATHPAPPPERYTTASDNENYTIAEQAAGSYLSA